jgi:hypothetical protein
MARTTVRQSGSALRRALGLGSTSAVLAVSGVFMVGADTAGAASLPTNCVAEAAVVTCSFSYDGTDGTDGSVQEFVVPSGITKVTIQTWGAPPRGVGRRAAPVATAKARWPWLPTRPWTSGWADSPRGRSAASTEVERRAHRSRPIRPGPEVARPTSASADRPSRTGSWWPVVVVAAPTTRISELWVAHHPPPTNRKVERAAGRPAPRVLSAPWMGRGHPVAEPAPVPPEEPPGRRCLPARHTGNWESGEPVVEAAEAAATTVVVEVGTSTAPSAVAALSVLYRSTVPVVADRDTSPRLRPGRRHKPASSSVMAPSGSATSPGTRRPGSRGRHL